MGPAGRPPSDHGDLAQPLVTFAEEMDCKNLLEEVSILATAIDDEEALLALNLRYPGGLCLAQIDFKRVPGTSPRLILAGSSTQTQVQSRTLTTVRVLH